MSDAPDSPHPVRSSAGLLPGTDISQFEPGQKIPQLGAAITEVISRNEDHLIFLDERNDIRWVYTARPVDLGWVSARVAGLQAKCGYFKDQRRRCWLNWIYKEPEHELAAKRAIAQGLVILFCGGTKADAETAFQSAEEFILQRGREASLVWLYSTFTLLLFVSVSALLTLLFAWNDDLGSLKWLALTSAACGGIGAFVSRSMASRTVLVCDANAGRRLHIQEAFLRWVVGSVAGAAVCLLIQGNVLLGGLEVASGAGVPVVLALALLSGMSERFLSTLLGRYEEQVATNKDETSGGAIDRQKTEQLKTAPDKTSNATKEAEEVAETDEKTVEAATP